MTKAIQQPASGLTLGYVGLGSRDGVTDSVRQQVHDGDTIVVRTLGNLSVGFLGVNASEISFTNPDHLLDYHLIPEEDRLFIPPEYVPLFTENGRQK